MKQNENLTPDEKRLLVAGARGDKSDVFENPTWKAFVAEAEALEKADLPAVVGRNLRD